MGNPFDSAGLFLIQSIFDLYIFIVVLRIILQWVNADFHNPFFHLVSALTTPPLRPVRRLIPVIHGIDLPAIVLLLGLEIIKLLLVVWLKIGLLPNFSGLIIWGFAEILNQVINIFFIAIIGISILSWVAPHARGPMVEALFHLTEPLLHPMRRIIPAIGGFDITPIPVLILLKLITIMLVQPLMQIGGGMALGIGS